MKIQKRVKFTYILCFYLGIDALEVRYACLFQEQFNETLIAHCVPRTAQLTFSVTEY